MNKYYSIAKENETGLNLYQLKNLGSKRVFMVTGGRTLGDWGNHSSKSTTTYTAVVPEDYNNLFVQKITSIKPVYDIENLLSYHYNFFINNNGTKDEFIKHIKYEILPKVKKRKDKEVCVELIEEWIQKNSLSTQSKDNTPPINIGDIHGSLQMQFGTTNSHQILTINYTKENINELFSLIKSDIEKTNHELKEDLIAEITSASKDVEKGRKIDRRLLILGGLMKDIGINVFANLIASPVFELVKPSLGI